MKKLTLTFAAMTLLAASMTSAYAAPLRTGLGGDSGFGELSQQPNDDDSSSQLNLPFTLNFFGSNFNKFFVNNNGNVSFGSSLSAFTPKPFPTSSLPIIAPYWADVDTRAAGAVYTAAPNANTVVVTWNNVGYFSQQSNKLNNFQMTLLNRADTGAGNFDIEFRYDRLEWTTGSHSSSGGVNGLGGIPAQAGYDAGDHTNFFVLPGSFTNDVLNLVNTSNVSTDTPGVWTMAIRNGKTSDGSSADAPLLPEIVTEDGFHFDFDVVLNQQVFIDPEVAVGYEYNVTSGPNITSALLPTITGDIDGYEIFGLDGVLLGTVLGGDTFAFGPGGVSGFQVRDIDLTAALDPADTQAFVTGLTFAGPGRVVMTQRPLTENVGTAVPEPSSLLLMGMAGLAVAARRRKQARAAA